MQLLIVFIVPESFAVNDNQKLAGGFLHTNVVRGGMNMVQYGLFDEAEL